MWHASIAEMGNTAARPTRWVINKKRPVWLAHHLLEGVGTGELYEKQDELAFHTRRSLSPEEIAGLDPAWLAIPPVDMAG